MKFKIEFNTGEKEGDRVVSIVENTLASADNFEVTKSNKNGFVSYSKIPTIKGDNVIDVEILSEPSKKEEILMIGCNIDKALE